MIALDNKCMSGTLLLDSELNKNLKSLMRIRIFKNKNLIRIPFVDPKKLKLLYLTGEYHSKGKSIKPDSLKQFNISNS